jgi:hypothetical protein
MFFEAGQAGPSRSPGPRAGRRKHAYAGVSAAASSAGSWAGHRGGDHAGLCYEPRAGSRHLARMDFAQLSALRERIEERVREMRETEGPALRERVMQQAAAIGMTIEELVQLGSKRRGRSPKNREED